MSVDPTPPSPQLEPGSKEAVRGGTRTHFNLWVLIIGLVLVVGGFIVLFGMGAGERGSTRADIGLNQQDAAAVDTTLSPAKGDSPVEGESVNAPNDRTNQTGQP